MGCWNGTCYISKLPIFCDEDTVMILCIKNKFAIDTETPQTCYPCDIYKPFGYAIYGKYDDYGSIDRIENVDEVVSYLNKFSFKYETRFNDDVTNYQVTAENLEEFLSAVVSEEIKFEDNLIVPMLIKRPLYDTLISHVKNRPMYSGKTFEHEFNEKVLSELHEIKNKGSQLLHDKTQSKVDDDEIKDILCYLVSEISIAQFIYVRDMSWEITNNLLLRAILNDLNGKSNTYEINKLLEIVCLKTAFRLLRIGYFCITGSGSQSEEMLIHKIVAEFILSECQNRIDEFLEEYDDDEDKPSDDEILSETLYCC